VAEQERGNEADECDPAHDQGVLGRRLTGIGRTSPLTLHDPTLSTASADPPLQKEKGGDLPRRVSKETRPLRSVSPG